MTKRLIDIDDALLDGAREALGTDGIADTVRGALREAIAGSARRKEVERLLDGYLDGVAEKSARDQVWR